MPSLSGWILSLPALAQAGPGPSPSTDPITGRGVQEEVTGETIVTATVFEAAELDAPYSTEVVSRKRLDERGYRTIPQALRDIPGVMIQETSYGQGSPYLRGFTGFRNVFLIDGVRLNHSAFRDGPNQYWNTVDPFSIERLEVVKGPSSVLYGSDAIGGTVQAFTKDPYAYGERPPVAGLLQYRVSSAEESNIGRAEASAAFGERGGLLLGGTWKDFGDLHGGRDTGDQENTGYDEWDADFKAETFIDDRHRVVALFQHVQQRDVPRTHSTVAAVPFEGTTIGSDLRRDLDQDRDLVYVQFLGEELDGAVDSYRFGVSWQRHQEERDRIRGGGNREQQGFDLQTIGLVSTMESRTSIGRLTYGFDLYHDDVDSFSSTNAIQGPVADDATYDLFGAFLQDTIEVGERTSVTLGGRFSWAAADADSVQDPAGGGRIEIEDDWSAVVGSLRVLYRLVEDSWHLFGGVSQGFRAPNLSDLTRFDSARTDEFEIPAPDLDPERTLSFEIGVKQRSESTGGELAFFYTAIDDQIVRVPTGNVNGAGEAEITKDNVGDGYAWGIELAADWQLGSGWSLFGGSTYIEGEVDTFATSAPVARSEYLDRLMPWTSRLGLRWDGRLENRTSTRSPWVELEAVYADDADKLSTRDAGDTQRIPPGGTPSYFLLGLRGGFRLSERLVVNLALDNLTDEDYRVHGSGTTAPGRNLIVGLTFRP